MHHEAARSIFSAQGEGRRRHASRPPADNAALETLKHSEEIRSESWLETDPANLAFIAMALHQLNRTEEAQATLNRLRDLCKEDQFAEEKKARAFLAEAERLLAYEEQR